MWPVSPCALGMLHLACLLLAYVLTRAVSTHAFCVCVPPAAGEDVLAEFMEEHPLWTTRALEAALRADLAER
jgi:hypothetical protein